VQHYWKHATSCSSCKNPDSGDTFSWAALEDFEPIDLRVKDGEATLTHEDLLKKAEEEIVERIQSRFHRVASTSTLSCSNPTLIGGGCPL
jgi:hypothetical protein